MDPVPIPRTPASGPHNYNQRTWVGNVRLGATPQAAYESLLRRATPFQDGRRISNEDETDIPFFSGSKHVFGRVKHYVFPEHLTVVNTTMEGHLLHPGNVHRSIVQEGDDLYVVTQGYGSGMVPKVNEVLAPPGWQAVDFGIRDDLNPKSFVDPVARREAVKSTDRRRELHGLMVDQHSGYWRGPKADALQQEYRDLIEEQRRNEISPFSLVP